MARARHPYLNARVAILAGRLLPMEQLENLVTQTLEEVSPEGSGQVELADILGGRFVSSEQTEKVLTRELLADFKILVRPLTGMERDFLVYWLRRYEMANIKTIIRGKIAGLSAEEIRGELADLGDFATLPIEDLLRTEDTAEMLRQLEVATPYGETAAQARQVYEKKRELFMLEATLDHRYLAGVMRRASAVDSAERNELTRIVGYVVERFNLIWLLRYRFTYHLSAAETYYLLIPNAHHRLLKQDLGTLAQLNSVDEVIAKLPPELRERLSNLRNVTAVEQAVEEFVREIARRVLHQSNSALAKVFAYLILRECQVNRILAIVKGRHMKLKSAVLRDGASLSPQGAAFEAS